MEIGKSTEQQSRIVTSLEVLKNFGRILGMARCEAFDFLCLTIRNL